MFRVAVKCKTEYLRTIHYLVITNEKDEAIKRSVERWNREEKIHPTCEAEVYEILELTGSLISVWKLDNKHG